MRRWPPNWCAYCVTAHHYYVAEGLAGRSNQARVSRHANEEQQHADLLAERVIQLGGDPTSIQSVWPSAAMRSTAPARH